MATVHFMTPPDVEPDDLTGHLILLGGVVWNEITGRLSEMVKLPVRQVASQELDSGEIFVAEVEGEKHQFWPHWKEEDKMMLAETRPAIVDGWSWRPRRRKARPTSKLTQVPTAKRLRRHCKPDAP